MRYLFLLLLFLSFSSFKPHPITAYPVVGYKEISFFDQFHQKSRQLIIWYPVEPQTKGTSSSNLWDVFDIAVDSPILNPKLKKPVVVISHGYGGSPHQLSWLINKLVYDGYIVLGIQHLDIVEGKPQINHWQRAQDIHVLLDQFVSQPFASSANLNQIGIAGFSVGGTTAIWLAGGRSTRLEPFAPGPEDAYPEEFLGVEQALPTLDKQKLSQDWRDVRIKAAFVMAPGWGWIFDKEDLKKITVPTYFVASDADNVLVSQNNAGFFAKNIPGSLYQIIPGQANHYVFISEPKEKDQFPSNLNFLIEDSPNVDRRWIQFEVASEASDFFNSVFSQP